VSDSDLLPAVRHDIADLCALLAEPSRVAMLLALMDGSARPAGELARVARVSAQTASAHFARLVAGGVLAVERQGRHRYYRLASDELAHAIEALGVVRPRRGRDAGDVAGPTPLQLARSCYRHLAGALGVQLRERLEQGGLIALVDDQYELTESGIDQLGPLLGPAALAATGRRCLDWTERRFHIGGALGNALLAALLSRGWLRRAGGGRALLLTATGVRGLRASFGLELPVRRAECGGASHVVGDLLAGHAVGGM
jgi:DNA-binding transcriptional ArsR family regulator